MAVSKRLRFEILKRDNHTCQYCGSSAPEAVLQVDHIIPTSLGGDDSPKNLTTACRDCNSGKSSSSPGSPKVDAPSVVAWAEVKTIRARAEATLAEAVEPPEVEEPALEQEEEVVYEAEEYEPEPPPWFEPLPKPQALCIECDEHPASIGGLCTNCRRNLYEDLA